MRFLVVFMALGLGLGAGCAGRKSQPAFTAAPAKARAASPAPTADKITVTPSEVRTGKIVKYNPSGRFVVINFPVVQVPPVDLVMEVYRQGLKVGQVRITGPQLDDNIVADVIAGEVAIGDLVRDQ
ncbi:MAG TPA: hypothetical protein PKX23_13870 [Verrucomicrobiota bacterium]|nr:hypothetical protein [Verrucomicrobiota bacterium]HRT09593.1 hypothetical protein [Candidatus Paceibacterota bacterium]HRT58366.1 hypothetical protein [Candidatus Paceibacterota bacterium]